MSEYKGILIYIEHSRDGKIPSVVFELAHTASKLSQKLDNCEVNGILITSENEVQECLKLSPFDKIFVAKDEKLKDYNTDYYSKIVIDLINEQKPEIFLLGATTQGRDLAPKVSSSLNAGLTADCIVLDINDKKQLISTRPTFGGNLMASILCKTMPQMATVRPKVLKTESDADLKESQFVNISVNLENVSKRTELLEFVKNVQNTTRLDEAQIVVAGGRGMKSKENFNLIKEFAEVLHGSAGASRAAVDLGFADSSLQIGQTGKTITPKLYIACGISGAVQHLTGINGSEKIIAINKDKNAPIVKAADFSVIADAIEVLPELINYFRNKKG